MINPDKIKQEKCQPPPLGRHALAPYFHLLFLIFQIPPPPGEVIKIYFPALKREGGGGRVRTMLIPRERKEIVKFFKFS